MAVRQWQLMAGETRSFPREIGLEPRTIPIESPQSNGMAETFVRTIKRDYVRLSPRPNAETVMRKLSTWIEHPTRFTRTRRSTIVHPASSSPRRNSLTLARSFGNETAGTW